MKSLITLILLFFSLCLLQAQHQHWNLEYDGNAPLNFGSFGHLIDNENSVTAYSTLQRIEISGLGKSLYKDHFFGDSPLKSNFYVDQNQDFILIGEIFKLVPEFEFLVFDPISEDLLYTFNANLITPGDEFPTVLKVASHEYLLFGAEEIVKISVANSGFTELSRINTPGIISAALFLNGTVYMAAENGEIYPMNGETIGTAIYTHAGRINDIIEVNGDLLFVGAANGANSLTRMTTGGAIVFDKSYGQINGQSLYQCNDGTIVFTGIANDNTGYVTKVDSEGQVLWENQQLMEAGVEIIEGKYGHIYSMGASSSGEGQTNLLKLGSNGESGPEIPKIYTFPLEVNDLKIFAGESPILFFDGSSGTYHYPADSLTSAYFAASMWMGGEDQNGVDRYMVDNYVTGSQMGPIGQDPSFFRRNWSVSHNAIASFRNDLADGVMDEYYLMDILEWPAKGNTIYNRDGESLLIEEELAPYIDLNGNDIYEPLLGDYPKIKGDHMLWWVYNDSVQNNPIVNNPIGVQVIGSLYAFECDGQLDIQNTSFLDLEIENKSQNTFPEFKFGFWEDKDLGCAEDDYVGSIPDAHSSFAYNMDDVDGNGISCGGVPFYSGSIPIQASTFLNYPMEYFMYMNGVDFGGPQPPVTTGPTTLQEYVNYMNGIWSDGTPLSFGGTGYSPGASQYDFAFDGNPAASGEWSLSEIDGSASDRRTLMSTSHANFAPGDVIDFKMAFTTFDDVPLPAPDVSNIKESLVNLRVLSNEDGLNYKLDLGTDNYEYDGEEIILDAGAGATSYLWQDGSTDQFFQVTSPGIYAVTVTTVFGCTDMDEIVFDNSVGLRSMPDQVQFSLSPNPSTNYVNINFRSSEIIQDLRVDVINTNGQIMLSQTLDEVYPEAALTFDLHTLNTGIYFVRCHSGKSTGTSRLVVVK